MDLQNIYINHVKHIEYIKEVRMEKKISAIIMAAGYEPDMESSLPIAMHKISGHPMVEFVLHSVLDIVDYPPLLLLREGADEISEDLDEKSQRMYIYNSPISKKNIAFLRDYLKEHAGYILFLKGNMPLLTPDTLKTLINSCQTGDYDGFILSALSDKNQGYGRIVRGASGNFEGIVGYWNATEEERLIREVNASVYCFNTTSLLETLDDLEREYSEDNTDMTNLLTIFKKQGKRIGIHTVYDPTEVTTISNRVEQVQIQNILKVRINNKHLNKGVTIIDPDNTYIGPFVEIGRDVTIYPGNILEGKTKIFENTILYPNNRIVNSTVGENVQIQNSVILESVICDLAKIGPYAYLRPGSYIDEGVKVGDFVEVKNAKIGKGSKVSHLSYIGDGEVGQGVNIGCGVIFVNYDGKKKHRTVVEDHAFVGCNSNLVAPVRVKKNAYVAAGSTITRDVPENALAIARERQINKEGWVKNHKNETEENK